MKLPLRNFQKVRKYSCLGDFLTELRNVIPYLEINQPIERTVKVGDVGKMDRGLRLIVGILLIALPFATSLGATGSLLTWGAIVVGGILTLTAVFKYCPA